MGNTGSEAVKARGASTRRLAKGDFWLLKIEETGTGRDPGGKKMKT